MIGPLSMQVFQKIEEVKISEFQVFNFILSSDKRHEAKY